MNNLAYLMAVERLAGIDGAAARAGDPRDAVRNVSHHQPPGLVRHVRAGSGQLSPVFYTFNDRERAFGIIEAICGARMHPTGFASAASRRTCRKDGTGCSAISCSTSRRVWTSTTRRSCGTASSRRAPKAVGGCTTAGGDRVGRHRAQPAGLRLRVGLSQEAALFAATSSSNSTFRPASTATATTAAVVRVEEMRQSLRIIEQCVNNMPGGPYKSDHPLDCAAAQGTHHARHRDPHHALSRA